MANIERANPVTGEIVRQDGAGGTTIERARETATAAMTAQATAEVQAAYIMARQHPRSWMNVRSKLLEQCDRPLFAEAALYAKPQRMKNEGEREDLAIGVYYDGFLEGLSVRFAEEAMRIAGNMRAGSMAIYDDDEKRIVRISAVDLESNSIVDSSVTVTKTIERASAKGRIIVAERLNSAGDPVYLLAATEDELRQKQGGSVSRERRNLILSLIPPDIKDEAEERIRATRKSSVAKDPDAERRRLADAFAKMGVLPTDLEGYLGHPLAQCVPAELETLRALYVAIKEGHATWAELVEERTKEPKEQPKTTKARKLAEEMRAKKAAAAAADAKKDAGATSTPTATVEKGEAKAGGDGKAQEVKPEAKGAKNTHRGEATDGEPPPDVKTTGGDK